MRPINAETLSWALMWWIFTRNMKKLRGLIFLEADKDHPETHTKQPK